MGRLLGKSWKCLWTKGDGKSLLHKQEAKQQKYEVFRHYSLEVEECNRVLFKTFSHWRNFWAVRASNPNVRIKKMISLTAPLLVKITLPTLYIVIRPRHMFVLTQNSFIWTLETDEKLTVTTIEGPAVVDSIWKANANRSNVTQPNANSLVEVTELASRTK